MDEDAEAAVLFRLAAGRVHQPQVGDPLLGAKVAGGLQDSLHLGDFGARCQGVLRSSMAWRRLLSQLLWASWLPLVRDL